MVFASGKTILDASQQLISALCSSTNIAFFLSLEKSQDHMLSVHAVHEQRHDLCVCTDFYGCHKVAVNCGLTI